MVPLLSLAAGGGVTTSLRQHSHVVHGSTAAGLVRSMHSNPVPGDHGHAYATIHPSFRMSVSTRQSGGMCRVSSVGVDIVFDLTLPVAANPGAMGKSTRRAWNSFVSFARTHEMHHKASYTDCAQSFVATARKQSAPACFALESELRQSFSEMKRDCETRQLAYDRSQRRALASQPLLVMARR